MQFHSLPLLFHGKSVQSLCLAALLHRLSRQCFSAAMLRILCHSNSAPCFALAHQCFALASQCHSISLLSARFHSIPCKSMAQLILSFAKRLRTMPFRCDPPQFLAIPLQFLSIRFSAIPQQLMPIQFRFQASPLCTTQIYSFAKPVLYVPLRSIPSLVTTCQS